LRTRKLDLLLDPNNPPGASMHATSTGITESTVRGMFRAFCAEMRRAVDLAVEAYGQGFAPPL
jgi:hypothetical protein